MLQTSSFDLHVLGTPLAFILSQDQTLRKTSPLTRRKLRINDWIDRVLLPITLQLLRCFLFITEAGCILPTLLNPVKDFGEKIADVFLATSARQLPCSQECL